jgi:RNA polymerase sigma factor (TIGR02999 family)
MQLTRLLQKLQTGNDGAMRDVVPLIYEELKKLARSHLRRERGSAFLETTTLVHEVFLKMAEGRHPSYENRAHFYGIASRLMRQILVDTARARAARKRGAGVEIAVAQVPDWIPQADRSVLALGDALDRLEQEDELKGRLIEMRYFCGLTAEESADALEMPVHKVRRELRLAHAWLRKEMAGGENAPAPQLPDMRRDHVE